MDMTVVEAVRRFLPQADPLSLPPRTLFLVEQAVELHNKTVAHSREMALEHVRQILWPLIEQAGHGREH